MFKFHLGKRILVNWVLECRPGRVVLVLLCAGEQWILAGAAHVDPGAEVVSVDLLLNPRTESHSGNSEIEIKEELE